MILAVLGFWTQGRLRERLPGLQGWVRYLGPGAGRGAQRASDGSVCAWERTAKPDLSAVCARERTRRRSAGPSSALVAVGARCGIEPHRLNSVLDPSRVGTGRDGSFRNGPAPVGSGALPQTFARVEVRPEEFLCVSVFTRPVVSYARGMATSTPGPDRVLPPPPVLSRGHRSFDFLGVRWRAEFGGDRAVECERAMELVASLITEGLAVRSGESVEAEKLDALLGEVDPEDLETALLVGCVSAFAASTVEPAADRPRRVHEAAWALQRWIVANQPTSGW